MRQKGFTLVELLVAIGIIGILSSIAVVSVSNVRAKARDAKRIGDIKQVQTALESYFNDQNLYPVETSTLGSATKNVLCSSYSVADHGNGFSVLAKDETCGTTYLNPVPKNSTPSGADYKYTSLAGDTYKITFTLESGSGTLEKGNYEATPNGVIKK